MDEVINQNFAELSGTLTALPRLSHENRGEQFFTFPLSVRRLSGTSDTINIITRERQLEEFPLYEGMRLHVFGQLRSFNNKSSAGAKLVISLFAREISTEIMEERNDVLLHGTICKAPNLRITPLGREICDFMLAVNRRYSRSDYLPCIAWGQNARSIAKLPVGTRLTITGRFQSRDYVKLTDSGPVHKTAYEISVIDYEEV